MKKVLLVTITLFSIGFTSCKKDFTCVCTENGEVVLEGEIKDMRRPEAATSCKALSTVAAVDCKLK